MKKGCITIGLLFGTLFASPFLANEVIEFQAADQIYESVQEIPESETALVLGAAVYYQTLSAILKDRVDTAIELYDQGKVDKIVMSGDENEALQMKNYAIEQGVYADDIIEDPAGLNTLASVENMLEISNSVTIVTQAYHLPRAIFIANANDLEALGMVADKQPYQKIEAYEDREFLATIKAIWDVYFSKD